MTEYRVSYRVTPWGQPWQGQRKTILVTAPNIAAVRQMFRPYTQVEILEVRG